MTPAGKLWRSIRTQLPHVGDAGSRSAALHSDGSVGSTGSVGTDSRFDLFHPTDVVGPRTVAQARRFFALRWIGTVGAILLAIGGLGAGALPVVGNPYDNVPFGPLLSRMLQAASALAFMGIGAMVAAWVGMAPLVGVTLPWRFRLPRWARRRKDAAAGGHRQALADAANTVAAPLSPVHAVTVRQMWRTWAGWVIPLIPTAPLFTQDIYSYLANGSLIRRGMDPYSAGPVQLLGPDDPLARSVPFIWANSPSPYGPVSLGLAEVISALTSDTIVAGVIAHRLLSIVGVVAAGWAIAQLARRCRVSPTAALWLGLLNPLTILHLIGGIHNESIMMGLAMCGLELGLRALDWARDRRGDTDGRGIAGAVALFIAAGVLVSCAGMVKVTGFIALGFLGMALAREWHQRRGWHAAVAISAAAAAQVATLVASVAAVTVLTGIGLGWVTGQGGAASIRSWLSLSTDVGVIGGFIGMLLGLGDHTEAMLGITRAIGLLIAVGFMGRMLLATFRGSIDAIGGLGVATAVLVVCFPVVHPWYVLWAVIPLAAWANRTLFRGAVIAYSIPMSFAVLPRGLALPPGTVASIYGLAIVGFVVVAWAARVLLRRAGVSGLD